MFNGSMDGYVMIPKVGINANATGRMMIHVITEEISSIAQGSKLTIGIIRKFTLIKLYVSSIAFPYHLMFGGMFDGQTMNGNIMSRHFQSRLTRTIPVHRLIVMF